MLRLQTFGGLALVDDTGAAAALTRWRLALIALLAVAGDWGVTREKLATYRRAQIPEAQARHAREHLVYAVRQQLPSDPFFGPDPLRLDSAVIVNDVGEMCGLARVPADRFPTMDAFVRGISSEPELVRPAPGAVAC